MDPHHNLRILSRPQYTFRIEVGGSVALLEGIEAHHSMIFFIPIEELDLSCDIRMGEVSSWQCTRYPVYQAKHHLARIGSCDSGIQQVLVGWIVSTEQNRMLRSLDGVHNLVQ